MTPREQQLKDIREACIAANPEKKWSYVSTMTGKETDNPCHLADVLLAINKADKAKEGDRRYNGSFSPMAAP